MSNPGYTPERFDWDGKIESIRQRCTGWDNSIDRLEKYCERLEQEIVELRRNQNVMMMHIGRLEGASSTLIGR